MRERPPVSKTVCPACSGPKSRGAKLCASCRARAAAAGVDAVMRRIDPRQITVFHARANELDKLRIEPLGTAKRAVKKRLKIESVKQLSWDEAEDVNDGLQAAIDEHRDNANDVDDELA